MALKRNIWPSHPKENLYFNHILEYLSQFYHNGIFCENKTKKTAKSSELERATLSFMLYQPQKQVS